MKRLLLVWWACCAAASAFAAAPSMPRCTSLLDRGVEDTRESRSAEANYRHVRTVLCSSRYSAYRDFEFLNLHTGGRLSPALAQLGYDKDAQSYHTARTKLCRIAPNSPKPQIAAGALAEGNRGLNSVFGQCMQESQYFEAWVRVEERDPTRFTVNVFQRRSDRPGAATFESYRVTPSSVNCKVTSGFVRGKPFSDDTLECTRPASAEAQVVINGLGTGVVSITVPAERA